MSQKLTTTDHSRDIAGLKYVYPVISRRAGGLSIGINFNTNNACNWRCVYCQVPELTRGTAPEMDFSLLQQEFRFFLQQLLEGDFYRQYQVPEQLQIIKDIAISGNGEPTSLKGFADAIQLIAEIASEKGVLPASNFVLITNGSLIHQPEVQAGLKVLNQYQGEVWFKLDSASRQGRKKINDCRQTEQRVAGNLLLSCDLCRTKIQTCMLDFLTEGERGEEKMAYLQFLQKNNIKPEEIMLYTLARPSLQPEAEQLGKMDGEEMTGFAEELRRQGYRVSIAV